MSTNKNAELVAEFSAYNKTASFLMIFISTAGIIGFSYIIYKESWNELWDLLFMLLLLPGSFVYLLLVSLYPLFKKPKIRFYEDFLELPLRGRIKKVCIPYQEIHRFYESGGDAGLVLNLHVGKNEKRYAIAAVQLEHEIEIHKVSDILLSKISETVSNQPPEAKSWEKVFIYVVFGAVGIYILNEIVDDFQSGNGFVSLIGFSAIAAFIWATSKYTSKFIELQKQNRELFETKDYKKYSKFSNILIFGVIFGLYPVLLYLMSLGDYEVVKIINLWHFLLVLLLTHLVFSLICLKLFERYRKFHVRWTFNYGIFLMNLLMLWPFAIMVFAVDELNGIKELQNITVVSDFNSKGKECNRVRDVDLTFGDKSEWCVTGNNKCKLADMSVYSGMTGVIWLGCHIKN